MHKASPWWDLYSYTCMLLEGIGNTQDMKAVQVSVLLGQSQCCHNYFGVHRGGWTYAVA